MGLPSAATRTRPPALCGTKPSRSSASIALVFGSAAMSCRSGSPIALKTPALMPGNSGGTSSL